MNLLKNYQTLRGSRLCIFLCLSIALLIRISFYLSNDVRVQDLYGVERTPDFMIFDRFSM